MTFAARTVLEDCSQAAAQLADGVQGAQWRISYMANIALLRAVYHVLERRDVSGNPSLRQPFLKWKADLLKSKPKPEIYWEFIVSERNLLLKEYQSSAGQGVIVPGVLFEKNLKTGEQKSARIGSMERRYTMSYGVFMGRDHRHLIQEAISWWYEQLELLEKASNQA
jgi:hypothetical protein